MDFLNNQLYINILEQSPFSGDVETSEPPPPYFTSYGNADIQSQLSAKPGYEGIKHNSVC